MSQFVHDAFWSTTATLMSSAFEIVLISQLWSRLPATAVEWWADWRTIAWLLTMPYWRIAHFYSVHRLMHKWNIKGIPDVGAFLYRHVHSLHHKSKSPVAFSGISVRYNRLRSRVGRPSGDPRLLSEELRSALWLAPPVQARSPIRADSTRARTADAPR